MEIVPHTHKLTIILLEAKQKMNIFFFLFSISMKITSCRAFIFFSVHSHLLVSETIALYFLITRNQNWCTSSHLRCLWEYTMNIYDTRVWVWEETVLCTNAIEPSDWIDRIFWAISNSKSERHLFCPFPNVRHVLCVFCIDSINFVYMLWHHHYLTENAIQSTQCLTSVTRHKTRTTM